MLPRKRHEESSESSIQKFIDNEEPTAASERGQGEEEAGGGNVMERMMKSRKGNVTGQGKEGRRSQAPAEVVPG